MPRSPLGRLDDRVDYEEHRFVILGMADGQILLIVAYTERDESELFRRAKQRDMSRISTSRKTLRPMSIEAIEKAARADPDAQPLTEADFNRMQVIPRVKIIRRALELTQEEFAERYHIPLGTLRDWEQGRAKPDQPTRAYLMLIARDPEHVNRTLNRKPA